MTRVVNVVRQAAAIRRLRRFCGGPRRRHGAGIRFLAVAGLLWTVTAFTAELPLPPDLPVWDYTLSLRVGGGYRDNLLLSDPSREASALIASTVEFSVFRLPVDTTQFSFFLSGTDTRYPQGHEVNFEQMLMALAEVKQDISRRVQLSLPAQYVYQDQVFDASITETNLGALPVRGHRFSTTPALRYQPSPAWSAVLDFAVVRQLFEQDQLDDYWEGGPRLTLGLSYGHRSEFSMSYQFNRRYYDTRVQFDAAGHSVPDTRLYYDFQRLELGWRHHWDKARRWRTLTRLGVERNRDNGSGYFDYDRYLLSEQVRYRADRWEVSARVRVAFYDYALQPATPASEGTRERTLIALALAAERSLGKHWKLFVEYEYEDAVSNVSLDGYTVNTATAGVDYEF